MTEPSTQEPQDAIIYHNDVKDVLPENSRVTVQSDSVGTLKGVLIASVCIDATISILQSDGKVINRDMMIEQQAQLAAQQPLVAPQEVQPAIAIDLTQQV